MNQHSPRQRDRSATEDRLLNAASAIFAKRGYDAATVLEVAELAETNVSLINRYFGGKHGLMVAITKRFIERKASQDLTYPPQDSLADEIYQYLHHRLRDDLDNQEMIKLTVSRVAIDADFRSALTSGVRFDADKNFIQRMDALKAIGEVSPEANAEMLFETVTRFAFSAIFFDAIVQGRSAADLDDSFSEFAMMVARSVRRS
jgi:AcrR family transcriptional regulator